MPDVRAVAAGFAATLKPTLPLPWPLPAVVSATQDADAAADQVQSRSVVTVTVPDPPVGPKVAGEPASDTRHRGGVAPVNEVAVEDPQAAAATAAQARARSSAARRVRSARIEVGSTRQARASGGPDEYERLWYHLFRALSGRGAFVIA